MNTSGASEGKESMDGYHCRISTKKGMSCCWTCQELDKVLTWKYERLHFHRFVCVAILCRHTTELSIGKVRRRKLKSLKPMYTVCHNHNDELVAIKSYCFSVESTHSYSIFCFWSKMVQLLLHTAHVWLGREKHAATIWGRNTCRQLNYWETEVMACASKRSRAP